ncbi:MAG: lytic transglycosylase domain-containing protein [Candidatus Gracilibacteria bacterium]|nr:lytic transglycosylase domain-containing protein [Candidatus Gracilibacteria bacterium]
MIEEAEWEKVKNFQALSELVMKADVDSIPFQNEKISQLIASTSGSDLLAESLDHPGLLSKLFLDVNGAERIVKFRGNYGALKYVGLGDLIPHTQEYVRVNGILGKRSINPRNGKVGYLNSAGRYLPVYGGEKIELLSDDQQFETPVQQTEFDQFKTATADFATLSLGEELEVKEDFQKSVKNNEKAEKKRIRKSGKLDAKTKKVLEEREARGEIEILKGQELLENREFSQKLDEICKNLGIQREHLVLVMQKESGINPQARNPNGGATGLIQFMPRTAEGLGTTVDALRIMSGVEQLEYVEKYYAAYAGKLNSVADLYMATFYPYALNKSDDYIIGSEKGADYVATVTEANKGILNRIGKGYKTEISKADFEEYVMA